MDSAQLTHGSPDGSISGQAPDTQVDRAEKTLDRLLEWIRAVDAKTPVVMAIDTAMLGALAAVAPEPAQLSKSEWAWIAVGSILLIVSLALCAMATFPQTKGPEGSLIYFGGIASRSRTSYAQVAQAQSDQEYLDDLLTQCHRNAEIATVKYARVRKALLWLVLGIIPWLIAMYSLSGDP